VSDTESPATPEARIAAAADHGMELAEQLVYVGAGLVLAAAAVAALVSTGHGLVTNLDGGTIDTVTATLDGLLLVFIFVELLGAVRATLAERSLVAEPFLIVGIIASIKAIVVSSLDASKAAGDAFDELMVEVAVLGVVILLLALSSWLVRRKEREPTEG
jgi:uncharacterized membrane protein (DUF373 family)